jgi:predicted TIM-barrel fold metal-dependent hydrolase
MDRYHEELQAAQAKIARLEAQLAGQRLPQEVVPYHTTASPRARDSATALLKQRLVLARILGCLPLLFTVSLDRSCEDVMLVINECCLQTCLSWIFV